MIALLVAPYAILAVCYLLTLDIVIGVCVYGALLIFNMFYAFQLPKLGFNGKQILFWNMLLKLCSIPLILLICVYTLVMMMVGGERIGDDVVTAMVLIALLACCLIQLSSTMFGISGFRWCHKYGKLSKFGMVVSSLTQFIPCVDVIGAVLCYIMFRKEGQNEYD